MKLYPCIQVDYKMNKFCDIYTTTSVFTLLNTKVKHFIQDTTNLLIKKDLTGFPNRDSMLICNKCKNYTNYLYEYDLNNKYVCPSCYYDINHDRYCKLCCKKYGCDSCGGNSNIMVRITDDKKDLLLCAHDRCLNGFGYYIECKDMECTCKYDRLLSLYDKLDKDNYDILCLFSRTKKNSVKCIACNKSKYVKAEPSQTHSYNQVCACLRT